MPCPPSFQRPHSPGLRTGVLVLAALTASGCFYSRRAADVERDPTVDTGMGAAIILPGQTAPALPYGGGGQSSPGSSTESRSGQPGAGQPSAGPITMIGGSNIDEEQHFEGKEEPLLLKSALTPFAVLAAPFVALAEAVRGDPEPGPVVPVQKAPRPEAERRPPPVDYETQRIQDMERELEQRGAAPRAGAAPPAPPAPPHPLATREARSIADELAELQRAPQAPQAVRHAPPSPVETVAPAGPRPRTADAEVADGIVDRDEDGRIDLWIYRENGQIVRKAVDQNFDGHPDTSLLYDPETHQLAQVVEDGDHDGNMDTWTDYRDGAVVRRRGDADRDGTIDTWSYYRGGDLTRHEQDTTGDGFRDRVGYYEEGRLAREEQDSDGDGRPDVTDHYDDRERIERREEDTDLDGAIDVVSHYQDGRLARRELLGAEATGTP